VTYLVAFLIVPMQENIWMTKRLDTIAFNEASAVLRTRSQGDGLTSFELGCYVVTDPATEMGGANGKSYRGLASTTKSGRQCQKWTDQTPWNATASFTPMADEEDPEEDGTKLIKWGNGLGNHNYCRNPDQAADGPWCYTMDPVADHEKESCEIPICPEERDLYSEATTLSNKMTSGLDCDCAAQLYGSTTTTAETAVSMIQGQAWGKDKNGRPCLCKYEVLTRDDATKLAPLPGDASGALPSLGEVPAEAVAASPAPERKPPPGK